MSAGWHETTELKGARWKAARRGLRLANSYLGIGAIGCFYAGWGLIGLVLGVALIPLAIMGQVDMFHRTLNPVALYGFVWPMALMAATTWAVKLFARLLWCRIPGPATAAWLAVASVAGRLSSVTVSSLAADGNPQAIPGAALRLAVVAPALLQILWMPGGETDRLIGVLPPPFTRGAARPPTIRPGCGVS